MLLFFLSIIVGLVILLLSADKFIDGASSVAKHYGMPPLLIGMIVIGFGTSAPEIVVSVLSSLQGNPGLAIGNAYGSNIANIGLILGITALIAPIAVNLQVFRKELPILAFATLFSIGLLYDHYLSRGDSVLLLVLFMALMSWTIREGIKGARKNREESVVIETQPIKKAFMLLVGGFIVLVISSRILVYGAVGMATAFGVSDILIGLTIVAVGTSLPELAASMIAARKGQSDLAIGNVLGSNLFNTLAVVGISGAIKPFSISSEIFSRDVMTMGVLTFSLFLFCYGIVKRWHIDRLEGGILLLSYIAYTAYLIHTSI